MSAGGRGRGFTLVELIAYLAIFTSFTGTLVAAELAARRLNRAESVTLAAMYEADRLFAAVAEDCDRARGVRVAAEGAGREMQFEGGSTYVARDGTVLRDGRVTATHVVEAVFVRPDAERYPRLLHVRVKFERHFGRGDSFERTYQRTFLVRNLGGGRGAF